MTSMANFFRAGSELVRWELVAVGGDGPYRLMIQHARGVIVEYFKTVAAALAREEEIEELLIAAREETFDVPHLPALAAVATQ